MPEPAEKGGGLQRSERESRLGLEPTREGGTHNVRLLASHFANEETKGIGYRECAELGKGSGSREEGVLINSYAEPLLTYH